MRYVKKALLALIAIFIVLAVVIFVGSMDAPDFDDHGLLDQISNVTDDENAYNAIAFTHESASSDQKIKALSIDEAASVLKHIREEEWDSTFVETLLSAKVQYIGAAVDALNYPTLKFPVDEKDPYASSDYNRVLDLSRLLVLKSMQHAKKGEIGDAINYMVHSTDFSHLVKYEGNGQLLNYTIALTMQDELLSWTNRLVQRYVRSQNQYQMIIDKLKAISVNGDVAFARIFSGELNYAAKALTVEKQSSFSERWRDKTNDSMYLQNKFDLKAEVLSWLPVFFPNYVFHKNRVLSELSSGYAKLANEVGRYCEPGQWQGEQGRKGWTGEIELSFIEAISPNSALRFVTVSEPSYVDYNHRRCLADTNLQASLALTALSAFEAKYAQLPTNLEGLVPEYLDAVPSDLFGGAALQYSMENGYVYSIGTNFTDGGGSIAASHGYRCYLNNACATNPTFALNRAQN